jgi:glycerol-3-phosphate acyltransferase PlsX
MPRIAVDAMGSDAAPRVEVEGVVAAVRARRGIDVTLVGDEARLRAELKAIGAEDTPIAIRHAPDVITMHDAPSMAVKQKKKASMRVCFDLVKAGEADAVVSAGNSGAMMACSLFVLGRLPGVERPAIVTTFPTRTGECALLDVGANVDPKPAVLAQFGVFGAVYARLLHGKARPKVGLLSNGSEEHKGTALTRDAHQILSRVDRLPGAAFSYLGYVEGRDIFEGKTDVVVTDGFTGNVMLKGVEGAAETMLGMVREEVSRSGPLARVGAALMRGALRRLRKRIDYAEHGGAPLLGVDGVALICHGGSSAIALQNAVYVADKFAQLGLGKELAAAVAQHAPLWDSALPPPATGAEAMS